MTLVTEFWWFSKPMIAGRGFIKGPGTGKIDWLWRWFCPPSLTTRERFFLEKKKFFFPACGNQYPPVENVYLMKPRHVVMYLPNIFYQLLWNFYIKLCFNYLPVLWCSSFLSASLQSPTHPPPLSCYRAGLNWLMWCWPIWDKGNNASQVQSIHGHAVSFLNHIRMTKAKDKSLLNSFD